MSDVTMTQEQLAAVQTKGRVIVSASAGSGKTFVMIRRLISLIVSGVDVRSVLAVTFTNKAAAQMREKLRIALTEEIGKTDGELRAHLKEQLGALPLADISTVHSFCARLLRTYFYAVDIVPDFRIVSPDDAEGKTLSDRALGEVFDRRYEEKDAVLQRALSVYFRNKKDKLLREIVLSVYRNVRALAGYREMLEKSGEDRFEEICGFLAADYRARAEAIAEEAGGLLEYFGGDGKILAACSAVFCEADALTKAEDLWKLRETALACSLPPMPRRLKSMPEEIISRLTTLQGLSASVKALAAEIAKLSCEEEERRKYADALAHAEEIAALVAEYDDVYSAKKREAGVLDYNDLEQLAIRALSREDVLSSVRQKYRYVFVDEYQDVNPAQEKITSLVGGEELFLVGDAKQSIYGFRGSRSQYFMEKTRELNALSLSENFRSAPAILEAVNRIFSRAMTDSSCGIDYAGSGTMRGGGRYGAERGAVQLHMIPAEEKETPSVRGVYSVLKEREKVHGAEAEEVVRLVEREIGSEWFDADSGTKRCVTFGDIAILSRQTKSDDIKDIVSALSEYGIPVSTTVKINICAYWEVRLIIDWLSYLDNARQDIPMAGAMLSRVGGFTDAELARIRLRFPSPRYFRDACVEYRETVQDELSEKLKAFAEKTRRYRILAQVKTAGELIGILLSDGLEAEIASGQETDMRLSRVRRLIAEGETCSVNELLLRLKACDYCIETAESGGENAVKVLTMHASKGLEYPVVILVGCNRAFHGADVREDVMWTEQFWIAPRSYDVEKKTYDGNVLRLATAMQMRRDELKGELNLFYVAMTRTKYRLHLLLKGEGKAPSPLQARCFADFIDFSACEDYFVPSAPVGLPPLSRRALVYRPDPDRVQSILSVYRRSYAHADSSRLPLKSSATELMRHTEHAELPHMRHTGGTAGGSVEEGLAYHAFLQHVRFGAAAGEELSRMARERLLTEEQLALLDPERIEGILALPSLRRLEGKRVLREQSFLAALPASGIAALETQTEDEIVVQGAIDLLCFEENDIVILDYKYSVRGDDELRAAYAQQLAIYKKAVARVTGKSEERIRTRILNILLLREIEL